MRKRFKMGRRQSRRNFSRGNRVNKRNLVVSGHRGGVRL